MGNFYSFFSLSSQIFHRSDDFFAKFLQKLVSCWHPYCALGIPDVDRTLVGISTNSAVTAVSLLNVSVFSTVADFPTV
jgi:hypothetical protein